MVIKRVKSLRKLAAYHMIGIILCNMEKAINHGVLVRMK